MILSIDIGIRNLSMCIMSATDPKDFKSYKIHLWLNCNTLEPDKHLCTALQKNGFACNKKCCLKYTKNNEVIYSCKSHFPKDIKIEKTNYFKVKLIKDYLLQEITTIVLKKLVEIYDTNIELFSQITKIYLEKQPQFAPVMNFVSHILYGKLVELFFNKNCIIKFVRASQKLKAYTGPEIICHLKNKYSQRKWFSVVYTKWFLENKFCTDEKNIWLPILNSNSIQADLSDAYLQAINVIHGLPKKQITDKNGKCIK
jgi:hypothetical protein